MSTPDPQLAHYELTCLGCDRRVTPVREVIAEDEWERIQEELYELVGVAHGYWAGEGDGELWESNLGRTDRSGEDFYKLRCPACGSDGGMVGVLDAQYEAAVGQIASLRATV